MSRRVVKVLAIASLLICLRSGTSKSNSVRAPGKDRTAAAERKAMAGFMHAALPFEANLGQADPAAKFLARGLRYTVFFTRKSVVLRLADPQVKGRDNVLEMQLVGARDVEIDGLDPLASRSHYFHGNSPEAWQPDVPHYGKVSYTGAYPDTNVVFYGRQGELEYDVVLGPRANPRDVVLQFSGVAHLRVNRDGDLVLALADGREILQRRPRIYQESHDRRKEVSGGYRILSSNRVRFEVGSYDRAKSLVIDPVLSYSSYLGGSSIGDDLATSVALDSSGNAYIAGYTNSTGFPTGSVPPIQPARVGGYDAFIAKLSADGTTLMYSTYLGGSADDEANGIAVDSSGSAYVVGYTYSTNFPATPGAYAHTQPASGPNVFLAKISPTGANLVYATYLGSGSGAGIAVDPFGFVYVTGTAYCCSFPTTVGAFQRTGSSSDAFITKLNQSGSALVWSTLVGGSSDEGGAAIALDSAQSVYVTGYTNSSNFPVTGGAYQTALAGNADAFVTKMNPSGTAPVYSTLLGGSSYESGQGIAVDSLGFAYVTGYTGSSNFPITAGVYQNALNGGQDAFITKLNQTGTGLVYSTHVGSGTIGNAVAIDFSGNSYLSLAGGTVPVTSGAYSACCGTSIAKLNPSGTALVYASQLPGYSGMAGIAVDTAGNVTFAGSTNNSFYPVTAGAYQPSPAGGNDAIVTKLNSSGTALLYSTFLGGGGGDQGLGVALDSSGNAYVTGSAASLDFPVTNEAAKSPEGPYTQVFVSKFNAAGAGLAYSTFVSGSGNDTGRAIAVDAAGAAYVAGQTKSSDFPVTVGAPQTAKGGGYDAFVFKLSAVGRLVYSTFIGGSSDEDGRGVAVDSGGNAYVVGNTSSSNFLATSTIGNPYTNGANIFISKLNPIGSAFTFSTLLGGSNSQYVKGLAVDLAGSAYITGYTYSSDFPSTGGAYQSVLPGSPSAFVTKLNPAGSGLGYSTFLGGYLPIYGGSYGNAIAVDVTGSAYVTGSTYAINFPVSTGAFQIALAGTQNAFVTKLNPAGSALSYSTYLGGSNSDQANAIAVDASGNAYVAGNTFSSNFPTTNGATIMEAVVPNYYSYSTVHTSFVTSLNPSGTALQYSTYLGGSYIDQVNAIAVQPGYAVVAGTTSSSDLIGASLGFQKTLASGAQNAFVSKISNPPAGCTYSVSPTSFNFGSSGGSGTVTVTAGAGCPWIAVAPSSSFVQLIGSGGITGSGSGSVSFTVSSDTYQFDSGNVSLLTVAGQLVSVIRTAPCAISLAASSTTQGPGSLASAFLSVNGGSCSWGAFTTTPWIKILSGSNSGNGTVNYSLLPNPQSSSRTGIIYVGPQTFTVTQLGTGPSQATIVSPPPGSVLTSPSGTFTWTPVSGADQYWLDVGTALGQGNLCAGATAGTSSTCGSIPTNGSTIYVQVWTHFPASGWLSPVRYTYLAPAASVASLLTPAPVTPYPATATTVLAGTQVTFTWSVGVGADQYLLNVGTAFGLGNLCSITTSNTFATCTNLPSDGSKVYVSLATHLSGVWQQANSYDYLACTATAATLTDPTPGSTLSGSIVTFKWTAGTGADQYWLDVGTSLGQGNICAGSMASTQSTCTGIPTNGSTIYVQVWTHSNGNWLSPKRASYTAASLNQRAQLSSPANLSALPGSSVTFTWPSVPGADYYWLDVGTSQGQGNICGVQLTGTSYTCNSIPVTASVYTPSPGFSQLSTSSTFCWVGPMIYGRLWTHINGAWQTPVDYTFNPPLADYWLDVGTAVGQGNISAGVVAGSCQTVSIPTGRGTIYVQLWTRIPAVTGNWVTPNRYTYQGP